MKAINFHVVKQAQAASKKSLEFFYSMMKDRVEQFPIDNEFKQDEVGILHSTSDSTLDGTRVKIVGMIADYSPSYRIYAIERCDGNLWWTGYKIHSFTSRCIAKE